MENLPGSFALLTVNYFSKPFDSNLYTFSLCLPMPIALPITLSASGSRSQTPLPHHFGSIAAGRSATQQIPPLCFVSSQGLPVQLHLLQALA